MRNHRNWWIVGYCCQVRLHLAQKAPLLSRTENSPTLESSFSEFRRAFGVILGSFESHWRKISRFRSFSCFLHLSGNVSTLKDRSTSLQPSSELAEGAKTFRRSKNRTFSKNGERCDSTLATITKIYLRSIEKEYLPH